jgi:hypothetical protein
LDVNKFPTSNNIFVYFREIEDDPVKRAILMVVLNALTGLVLKASLSYSALYDGIHLIIFLKQDDAKVSALFNYSDVCAFDLKCQMIDKTANFLYLISLSTFLIFYYKFDKLFCSSFKRILDNIKSFFK